MELASGHKAEELEGEELAKQMKDFKGYKNGLVRLNPGGPWLFPKAFLKFADKYYNFKFRPSDVVLVTYPKSGTTWTQEIVWTMRNNPDLNNPDASLPGLIKIPFLETDTLILDFYGKKLTKNPMLMEPFERVCPGKNPDDGINLQIAENIPEPRTIKTHLALSLLPPSLLDTCKVVYVARNPKDLVVSYHHHSRMFKVHGYEGTMDDFVEYFVNDQLLFGAYDKHLKEAWEKRNHPNMHIMFFEDMKKDMMHELKRLNTFLGTNLTQHQLEAVAQYTSFKEMKKRNPSMPGKKTEDDHINTDVTEKEGGFFRKGETGDWKNKLSPELSTKLDTWIDNNLNNIGMDFKYST